LDDCPNAEVPNEVALLVGADGLPKAGAVAVPELAPVLGVDGLPNADTPNAEGADDGDDAGELENAEGCPDPNAEGRVEGVV
jgi:hypothetical protein